MKEKSQPTTTQQCSQGKFRLLECKSRYERTNTDGMRVYFCETHQQWINVFPVSAEITFHYENMPDVLLRGDNGVVHGRVKEVESEKM